MAAVTGSIEGRRFVTMRFKRIKTWAHVYHLRRHNTREMECKHLEAGAPEPPLLVGGRDVSGAIRAVLAEHAIRAREGEVLALEFVISASREVFDDIEDEERLRRVDSDEAAPSFREDRAPLFRDDVAPSEMGPYRH